MDTPEQPIWLSAIEKRLRPHVIHARDYIARHNHGIPGHLHLVTIDALSKQLDAAYAELAELRQQIANLSQRTGGYQL